MEFRVGQLVRRKADDQRTARFSDRILLEAIQDEHGWRYGHRDVVVPHDYCGLLIYQAPPDGDTIGIVLIGEKYAWVRLNTVETAI